MKQLLGPAIGGQFEGRLYEVQRPSDSHEPVQASPDTASLLLELEVPTL